MSGTVLTNKGLALITKLVAASTELQISRVAVGTGRVPSGVDPQTMVDLNEYKMDAQIESYGVSPDQSDVAYIAAQVSSIGVSAGFAVTEAGVFATDPDVGEILYAYLDLTEDPQYIYAETDAISKFAEITFNVLIGSVTKVTAYVSPGALTKKVDFNAFKESVETPEFDDSGTVSGISSFPDFLNLVKSKMNFFQFFRNFKAGMQFVLHAGQIVNNCVTDNAGLPLSAAQGKVLKDLYTQLYSDSQATSGALAEKAPKSHASTDSIYGKGTTSAFGHLKVSDNYASSAGAAADGVAASSKALSDAYKILDSDAMRNRGTITSFTADSGWNGGSTIIDLVRTAASGATRKTGILSFQRSGSTISTGTTSSVGTIAKTYAPYTGSTTMAFSGSNGATGTCVIASDGSVKITPYGKAVSQYETITVPIYYG